MNDTRIDRRRLLLGGVGFLSLAGCKQGDGGGGLFGGPSDNERRQSMNNLLQLGLAMHNYHDTSMRLPFPGIGPKGGPLTDASQKPLLSWRVALLPFLEQDSLYKQFKLDEPWDSESNKKLIAQMPSIYRSPAVSDQQPGMTHYQIFTGSAAWRGGMRFTGVKDGLSNTIVFVEAAAPVTWTKPDDITYDPSKPLPKLGFWSNGFYVCMGDGSVRFISRSANETMIRAAITPDGNEMLAPDWEGPSTKR